MSNRNIELKPSWDYINYMKQEVDKGQEQEAAQKGLASPPPQESQTTPAIEKQNKRSFEPLPFGFFYQFQDIKKDNKIFKKGIYKVVPAKGETEEPTNIRIGDLLYFMGYACDEDKENWGLYCKWIDPSGHEHKKIIPFDKVTNTPADWFTILASGGYRGNKKELVKIFQEIEPQKKFILLNKIGWKNKSYTLPNKTISQEKLNQEYVLNTPTNGLYSKAGEPEKWQEVKSLIQGNTRLEFAYLTAFAGVLLDPANFESFGFAFEGQSSCGKTTALQVASAVWGGKDHIKQWRATSNALEGLAELFNDNLLLLDELGQVTGKDLDNAIYMLANGQGKSRANKNGDSRQAKKWRLLFLSSGEIGFAQKLAEDGKRAKAGQEVRFIGISTSREHISTLHGLQTAKDLVDKVKQLTAENYGFDGVKFIEFVVTHYERIKAKINGKLQSLSKEFYQGNNTQISRVATHFALIEYTRLVLIGAGLIPNDFAVGTVKACFDDWTAGRENTDSHEEQEIIDNLRLFLEVNGASRFQNIVTQNEKTINRVGFIETQTKEIQVNGKKEKEEITVYLFLPQVFKKEICLGHDLRTVCKVLVKNNYLLFENKMYGYQVARYIKDMGKTTRLYAITLQNEENI